MVTLPRLENYSATQLQQARALSPAYARYENLLADGTSFHARRHRAWMECTLATYFQRATTAEVCAYWTATADTLLREAWGESGLATVDAALFTLGKHGAEELNLSSDIDLMIVAERPEIGAVEKGLRRLQQRLHHAGEDGFCFRLDFDLRPGGKMGPLITTPAQFQDYYWSQGETWERLALVRLRAITGAPGLQQQILELARRFSFRKFLDFTLLDDLKALRSQVHQKGFERRADELHLKLEVGGIRDIELFVHSLLVLNGGKLPTLQTRSTSVALQLLKENQLLPAHEADFLLTTYWYYRSAENMVQSVDDRQTHALPLEPLPIPGLPASSEVQQRMRRVDQIVSSLLGKVDVNANHLPQDLVAQKAWLTDLGFSTAALEKSWDQLIAATALSHKNDRDERLRQQFLFSFVNALASHTAPDRDLGLSLLVDFVRATRAKATFFAMLLHTPRLIQDLARLFCLSPYLGSIVASRPELLDHFILQVDETWASGLEPLLQQMYERKLLTELWAANQFLNDRELGSMFMRISDTADSIGTQLLLQLKGDFPSADIAILTLGKWGGQELGLRSDLDFIFVTPGPPNESDFKVARRFISRLTDPSKSGSLYDVDLRLRPSGQSGPLLVARDQLQDFWRNSAQAWQRQAYLRARPLQPSLLLNKETLLKNGLTAEDLVELRDIRHRLLRPATAATIDIKYTPGGLLDIEFVCQTAILNERLATPATGTAAMMGALADHAPKWRDAHSELARIYARLREFEQMLQLSSTQSLHEARLHHDMFAKAAALMKLEPQPAWTLLTGLIERSKILLNALDPLKTHSQNSAK